MKIHIHLSLLLGISSFDTGSTTGPEELGFLSLALSNLLVDVFVDSVQIMFPDLLQLSVQRPDMGMIP